MELNEIIEELEEARDEITDALRRAKIALSHLSKEDKMIVHRAETYWLGHIGAATGVGDRVNRYDTTMQTTIDEIEELAYGTEDEDGKPVSESNEAYGMTKFMLETVDLEKQRKKLIEARVENESVGQLRARKTMELPQNKTRFVKR